MTQPCFPGFERADDPRRDATKRATAAVPGTGPDGETCETCRSCCKVGWHNKYYYKCELMERWWTHGAGTDIRLKWAACSEWREKS